MEPERDFGQNPQPEGHPQAQLPSNRSSWGTVDGDGLG